MTLTVTSRGTKLKKYGSCLEAERPDGKDLVPVRGLDAVLITAPCSLTSEAIVLCMERNIPITMLDWKGAPLWRIDRIQGGAAPLIRRRQLTYGETKGGVAMAKRLLTEKNKNRIVFLKYIASNRRNKAGQAVKECCAEIEAILQKISDVHGESVKAIRQTLLGYEGTAGRAYYRMIGELLPQKANFQGRLPGSGEDVINQMLNYGYGVLYHRLYSLCVQACLDPYIGILHADAYNEPVLVYDLIEPFRVTVESAVFKLASKGRLSEERHLEPAEADGKARLSGEAKRLLLTALEQELSGKRYGKNAEIRMKALTFELAAKLK